MRSTIRDKSAKPVIPGRKSCKRKIRFDRKHNKYRWMVEAVFCWLKDFWRITTRRDNLSKNYASSIIYAIIVAYWI